MFGLVSRVPAGHDEFRGIGVSDQILALGSAVRQTDCPMSGFRPLWFITRLAPLRLTGGSPPELVFCLRCWRGSRPLINAALGQQRPYDPGRLVRQRDRYDLERLTSH